MANGSERSIEPLVIANQEENTLSLQPITEKKELADSPTRTEETASPIPEKKSWWKKFSKDKKTDDEEKEQTYPSVNPIKIFKYATVLELMLLGVAMIAGTLQGGAFPFVFLAIGEVLDAFFKFETTGAACTANYFANTSSTCSIGSSFTSALNTNSTPITSMFNLTANTNWFFCTASRQGVTLNISTLSSITEPIIDQYCYNNAYYNRLAFADNMGCCSTFDNCVADAKSTLYMDVLLCNVMILVGIGVLAAICSYIEVNTI
ncbi:hypothetical protein LOD99_2783 [Oopsacas minuta]|uniref:Uncharacterized protein n=1 Tax=Oopsacas minuta TaxID=111878 RepID=A0AAV7K2U9_9METZ|nr:hypothetical protein LOD99_2783 [Oopsacas minuta]